MMNRRISLLAFTLLLCSLGWWWLNATANQLPNEPAATPSPHSETDNKIKRTEDVKTSSSQHNPAQAAQNPDALSEAELAAKERQSQLFEAMAQEYRQLRQQAPGNLQAWLDTLWQQCQAQSVERCEQQLTGLAAVLSAEEMAELKALLLDYQQYQQQLGQLILSTAMSPQQRFAEIKALREQTFGQMTDALFGQEHQFAEYQFKLDEFQQLEAAGLPVAQRLAKLAELQQNSGISAEGLIGPDQAYQQALRMINDLPAAERAEWQDKLRQQYFGDEAKNVAAYEQQQRQQLKKMQAYQQALRQLEARFAALKSQLEPQVWQAQYAEALQQLRLSHFPN